MEERLYPYGQLPRPCADEAGRGAGAQEAELPGAASKDCDARPDQGQRQGRAGNPGRTKADTTVNVYMQPIEEGVKQTLDAIYAELTARPKLVAVS